MSAVAVLDRSFVEENAERRWRAKVTVAPTGCWHWVGAVNAYGYGVFWYLGRTVLAHRFAYQALYGDLSADHVLMHACDNPRCVRPDHLRAGSQVENLADMRAKGRAGGWAKSRRGLSALAAAHESPRAARRLEELTA